MKKYLLPIVFATACMGGAAVAGAAEFNATVPMKAKGAATFYVPGHIDGLGPVEMMVDTGSGYMTINEVALRELKRNNHATYVRDLRGVLANGSEMIVPVYKLKGINIGGSCRIDDVEAAVFPGKTRFILGLSVLQRAAPFIFSMNPASLVLSHCGESPADRVATTVPAATTK
jgi:predicted aspartyl protease